MAWKPNDMRREVYDILRSRIEYIDKWWDDWCNGKEDIEDYGIHFDYVPSFTFNGQREGYFRWRFKHGYKNEEFRFYTDLVLNVYKIRFVYEYADGEYIIELGDEDWKFGAEFRVLKNMFHEIFLKSGKYKEVLKKCRCKT